MLTLTKKQARQFILLKQGLLGKHRFIGKQGALEYVQQAGCIQFDPVDICGKNAELTLQSRVKSFRKEQLSDLLYKDRSLFDYTDKQLSIIPTECWPYFERFREISREQLLHFPEINEYTEKIKTYIEENGAVCSDDFDYDVKTNWRSAINWSWGGSFARSVLEQMYSSGDLIIHHKKGTRRYYELAENYLPREILTAADPLPDDYQHQKWCVLRRIGAVGLLWDNASGAWLNIWKLNTAVRHQIIKEALEEGTLSQLNIEGIKPTFYFLSSDLPLLEQVMSDVKFTSRCEMVSPLDPMMWDKKMIRAIFDFNYMWEIYTPDVKRQYGAYVLPLLWNDRFIGRVEPVCNRKNNILFIKNVWLEEDVKMTKKLDAVLLTCFRRFAAFHNAELETMYEIKK